MTSPERHGVSNHRQFGYLSQSLLKQQQQRKFQRFALPARCEGNHSVTSGSVAHKGTAMRKRVDVMTSSRCMMTSSNGNIFRVTGPLCGEFTGPGEFPTQRPVTRSFDVYFDLRLNKRLCKQSWGWWFQTLLCPLWRHSNGDIWDIMDKIRKSMT